GQTYRVSATWLPHPNRATNAPYTVLDGTTALGTVPINQVLAPNDFSDAGGVWEDLGTFTISGATLVVRLSDAANGYVIADAIRIAAVSPLQALGGPIDAGPAPEPLTTEALAPIVAEAIARWQAAGVDRAGLDTLASAEVRLADLPGSFLGLAEPGLIWVDA